MRKFWVRYSEFVQAQWMEFHDVKALASGGFWKYLFSIGWVLNKIGVGKEFKEDFWSVFGIFPGVFEEIDPILTYSLHW